MRSCRPRARPTRPPARRRTRPAAPRTPCGTRRTSRTATAVDATARDTPSASTFGIGAGIWLLVSNLVGLAAGGYAAARLSGTSDGTDATLHGLGVWAVAFLVSAGVGGHGLRGGPSPT